MLATHLIDDYIPKNVSRETLSHLESYTALLLKWNATINLISEATENDVWLRHITDSLQLIRLIPNSAKTLLDIGSGAGLPGIVIAIAAPQLTVTLVERDQRKAAFLTEVNARLNLRNLKILASDIEAVAQRFDTATARAFAPLETLFSLIETRLTEGGVGLFPKGAGAATELASARMTWEGAFQLIPSETQENSYIVHVRNLARRVTPNQSEGL